MKKKMLIELPTGCMLEVSPALFMELLECKLYKSHGYGTNKEYEQSDESLSIILAKLPGEDDLAVENEALKAEIERLTYELRTGTIVIQGEML
jgi:hypothetical protein